jgi:tripartite-type tricarboxylate transporter receptor subunit TctC
MGYDATFQYGLLAPAGTPPAVVNKPNQHLRAALADVDTVKPVQAQGLNPRRLRRCRLPARIKADYENGRKLSGVADPTAKLLRNTIAGAAR